MVRTVIVDDDTVTAAMIRRFVERVPGFEVVAIAESASAARIAVEEHRPQLMLLDLNLPDAHGLTLAERLRRDHRHLDVIVITRQRDIASVRSAMRGGALHYLVKPVRLSALIELLQRYTVLQRRAKASTSLNQDQVNELFGVLHDDSRAQPKGITTATLESVLNTLLDFGEQSADEVAETLGLSRPTAARYLKHLTTIGTVSQSLAYGVRGRPQHRYRALSR